MDRMSEYLARATIKARLTSAQQRRQGRQIENERRAERWRERRLAIARWWQCRAAHWPDVGARGLAEVTRVRRPSVELAQVLLEAMSDVAARSTPGAAAALVDRAGTEAARLRAFGHVHTHLLEVLGPREHAWLLDLLDGGGGLECPSCVA
jgi:hypothetical protein